MKKVWKIILTFISLFSFMGCNNQTHVTLQATVLEVNEASLLVEPIDNRDYDEIRVEMKTVSSLSLFKAGDLILITYNGLINETDLPQFNKVYKIEKLE